MKQLKNMENIQNKLHHKENKFEFILKINDHIIISRYFSADNYNPQVRNSVDIRNCVEDIVDHIQETLKLRDIEYQWGQYDFRPSHWLDHTKNGLDTN